MRLRRTVVSGLAAALGPISVLTFFSVAQAQTSSVRQPSEDARRAVARGETKQRDIPELASFPAIPTPFVIRDWQQTARDYAHLIFDGSTPSGPYLPLLREDPDAKPTRAGYGGPRFGLPSYVGGAYGNEALAVLGAVLGGTLAGVDETGAPRFGGGKATADRVGACNAYFCILNGQGYVLNNIDSTGAGSYWYDLFPSILYAQIADRYPQREDLSVRLRSIADSWRALLPSLRHDWQHTGFDFRAGGPVDRGWREPDAPAGVAYLEMAAYERFHDPAYLRAAESCLQDYENSPRGPFYEVLGLYGPLLAARLNAEHGARYDLEKTLHRVFESSSDSRPGWGCISARWGDHDAYGLMGSSTDSHGYAFAMNTFAAAAALAPVARYAPQYSRALAKYLLAVSVDAGLFYPDALPADHQSDSDWYRTTGIGCIAYEGVRNQAAATPYATGDAKGAGHAATNLCPYAAWGAGYMAALVRRTDCPQVLMFDLLATDFFHGPAYPTYLLYNPTSQVQRVQIPLTMRQSGKHPPGCDLYDVIRHRFIASGVDSTIRVAVPAGDALQIVVLPARAPLRRTRQGQIWAGNAVVDFGVRD